jgi:ribosomal protein S18 acetylase RimI-like enzyme
MSQAYRMLSSSSHVRVRRGKLSDAKALAFVFRDSWELAYRGIIPQLHLETMIRRRNADWWRTTIRSGDTLFVLEISGKIAGYATCGVARARGQQQGEIYEIYLAPLYQGLGFGEHLFEACRHALDMRRLNGLVVWALAENEAAVAFYWRRGGRPIAKRADRIGDAKLSKLAFAWG